MTRPLPQFRPVESLVPQSGIQFMDFRFAVAGANLSRAFLEEKAEDGGLALTPLTNRSGEQVHPDSGKPVDSPTHRINPERAFEPFLGVWMPVPFMRLRGVDKNKHNVFADGPSNWTRVFVEPEPDAEGGMTHRLVLAFDTAIDTHGHDASRDYVMPTISDVEQEGTFGFSAADDDIGWFIAEAWVDRWVEEAFHVFSHRRSRTFRPEMLQTKYEHLARYATFLSVLGAACPFPMVRLIDTFAKERSFSPIKVDLVIDVGNSRTCGILIESDPVDNERFDLARSSVLTLRDLSRPAAVYDQPFESRVEFNRASLGNDGASRLSGRADAFRWPSLVRIGPEAVRLSVASGEGPDGITGMSSPKRYLWDSRPANQMWRFKSTDGSGAPEQVSGWTMALVTETGDVLRQMKEPGMPAIRPKFSPSSLFTFLMTEIVVQAVAGINSHEHRWRRGQADIPRELRQIVMTVPPAMPLAERRLMQLRVEGALKLAWQSLGWTERRGGQPQEPVVRIAFDEATCTQIVWLYTEVMHKLRSRPSDLFRILGKTRPEVSPAPTLRVASLDIGGGTTDLMVTTYKCGPEEAIVPVQMFREGFKRAGDDILQAIVGRKILPAIEAHLTAAGLSESKGFLRGIVGPDRSGLSEQERQFRRRFVNQICVPAALALLHDYEGTKMFAEEPQRTTRIGALLQQSDRPSAADEFAQRLVVLGLPGIDVLDTPIVFDTVGMAAAVKSVVSRMLNDLAEVIHGFDCDVVLLSGRPSRLPIVLNLLMSRLPVRPDRVIPMHQYTVGKWYPFRDRSDRIDDPKTTVAVGALLCGLAEAHIEGFTLLASELKIRSTAKYIGPMEPSGILRKDRVLFADMDLDAKKRKDDPAATLTSHLPVTIGFRQLAIERWPATPLYFLEYGNAANANRPKGPLRMTVERFDTDSEDEAAREDFRVTEVYDRDGAMLRTSDVSLRLQTLRTSTGYWLDTGAVEEY